MGLSGMSLKHLLECSLLLGVELMAFISQSVSWISLPMIQERIYRIVKLHSDSLNQSSVDWLPRAPYLDLGTMR